MSNDLNFEDDICSLVSRLVMILGAETHGAGHRSLEYYQTMMN